MSVYDIMVKTRKSGHGKGLFWDCRQPIRAAAVQIIERQTNTNKSEWVLFAACLHNRQSFRSVCGAIHYKARLNLLGRQYPVYMAGSRQSFCKTCCMASPYSVLFTEPLLAGRALCRSFLECKNSYMPSLCTTKHT